ncbi:methyl-accepting chemotaxis protein [Saccharophagus degradans]|uniref:methyl-accepting chemotaxis protein n=1 Tax=Saccharophagus degradans TaxID=86304 RepID=UPI0024782790|nr:methyl-accepting chemotaxis protein [Saccharophagus degradans]WGP00194.1 methyl-accepting chemotaxis protein [Saccharophagus degradans]
MILFRRVSIKVRLWLLLALVLVGLIALVTTTMGQLRSSLHSLKSNDTRLIVELAHSTLDYYYQKQITGELPKVEAQAQAIAALKSLRYDNDNYFWVHDSHPIMIMHALKPSLDGTDVSHVKDPNGRSLFVEMAKVAKTKGEGEVAYMWPLPGQTEPTNKLSYVKSFKPWGWIVGSGVYLVDVQATFLSASVLPTTISLIVLILVGVLTYLIARSIIQPLAETNSAMNDIAAGDGDLTQRLYVDSRHQDEISVMSGSFNVFVSKIEQIILQVSQATERLTVASGQLREITQNNARSMDQQQAESHAVASAITEMACTATEIAKNSEGAASSATQANDEASSGQNIVTEAINSVKALAEEVKQASAAIDTVNTDSQAISSVLDVIRSIAEQTNLLALNAAIEAARAGEQGRGFAVVADEVRTLAARTQASTEEIRGMIESLQQGTAKAVQTMKSGDKATELTVSKAEEAGHSLENIVTAINSITDMNIQIASSAEEQSAVAQEIDQSINRMAQLLSQSHTEIEKTTQFSSELEELSNSLSDLVGHFKTHK